jgi:predicted nucleotidyltransferase
MNEMLGEAVLDQAVALAREAWEGRLLAAYALGSLAHGGFSALVSDVDLGLVLADPLAADDAARVAALGDRVRAAAAPLADRLSVFWGSPAALRGAGPLGRFPPLDRLDLLRYGRLLAGRDVRDGLPTPTTRELVLAAAEQALRSLAAPAVVAELDDPEGLVAAGARHLTKRILFPVRFLYTAQTGEIGRNHDAVAHFVATESGPMADLAAAALRWRETPPEHDRAASARVVAAGIKPLYRHFVADHERRLHDYDEPALAERFAAWRAALGAS